MDTVVFQLPLHNCQSSSLWIYLQGKQNLKEVKTALTQQIDQTERSIPTQVSSLIF